YCAAAVERACLICEILTAHFLAARSGGVLSVCGHTGLADHRRSVSADWNYGALCFSTENSAVPHGWLALVSGNTSSGYRNRSGWRANHGGPLLLYSVDRFVHCAGVRISRHRQELACYASAQWGNRWRGPTDFCYSHKRANSALA